MKTSIAVIFSILVLSTIFLSNKEPNKKEIKILLNEYLKLKRLCISKQFLRAPIKVLYPSKYRLKFLASLEKSGLVKYIKTSQNTAYYDITKLGKVKYYETRVDSGFCYGHMKVDEILSVKFFSNNSRRSFHVKYTIRLAQYDKWIQDRMFLRQGFSFGEFYGLGTGRYLSVKRTFSSIKKPLEHFSAFHFSKNYGWLTRYQYKKKK